jgi:uncharacterized protein
MIAGQVIAGSFGSVIIRQKAGISLDIGQLLTAETKEGKILLQVFDLQYGSQLSQQNLELVSGMKLESQNDLELMDAELRTYTLAFLKPLLLLKGAESSVCKILPTFFSPVHFLDSSDLLFLKQPENPLLLGALRSGSQTLPVKILLDGAQVFSHHVLIAAQTGRGKSNLTSCMLLSAMEHDYAGVLVLDPHDEYYGRNKKGLKDASQNISYYTPTRPPPGARSLTINIRNLRPSHFRGVTSWSDAQRDAVAAYYSRFRSQWVEAFLREDKLEMFHEATLYVVKRRLMGILNLQEHDGTIIGRGVFDATAGTSTVNDIVDDLEKARIVIVDTSSLSSSVEILVGSIIASETLSRYQRYKASGELDVKPVISVILEEAPRVLGKEALDAGPNIFAQIAREGRKFKVGITAITQLPSLIPRQILANIGTKIILGVEMAPERKAIIESSPQDLSRDDRAIASLDIGEAIVTSTFSRFAIPVKIPLFHKLLKQSAHESPPAQTAYPGLRP